MSVNLYSIRGRCFAFVCALFAFGLFMLATRWHRPYTAALELSIAVWYNWLAFREKPRKDGVR